MDFDFLPLRTLDGRNHSLTADGAEILRLSGPRCSGDVRAQGYGRKIRSSPIVRFERNQANNYRLHSTTFGANPNEPRSVNRVTDFARAAKLVTTFVREAKSPTGQVGQFSAGINSDGVKREINGYHVFIRDRCHLAGTTLMRSSRRSKSRCGTLHRESHHRKAKPRCHREVRNIAS
jgi:hypothetical protein